MVTKVKTVTATKAGPSSVEVRPGSCKVIKTDSPPVPKSPKSPTVFPMPEPDGPLQHSGGHLQVKHLTRPFKN